MSDSLAAKLDQELISIFSLLETYNALQEQLSENLKQAFICTAQIRYNHGQNALSLWKMPNKFDARLAVDMELDGVCNLTALMNNETKELNKDEDLNVEIERQRLLNAFESNEGIEMREKTTLDKTEPLNWFGVFLRQHLTKPQIIFKNVRKVLRDCCELSMVKRKIQESEEKYIRLLELKKEMSIS
ncbi:hypothetical protein O9G_004893 [Rozella allomycis CSF55]|uniref:Vacuolar ATPase assembly protein VMA22 n=1 Tax=Rozella allomycis (strain CSF55) TaxID=988480 RepID=A0A075ARC5_ROZAC|nr:hypothetical protein O9G_004893 [Rozella allomycis CSF55]|eukprot:EPZ32846.1 hypothetical protein O9G_004893 [Rozella allomycis CSF55]